MSADTDARAAQDASQFTIGQNKNTLLTLKQENKDLRANMAKRSSSAVSASGGSGGVGGPTGGAGTLQRAIEKMEREVHELRRVHDRMLQDKKTAVSKLDNLQDSARAYSSATAATAGSIAQLHGVYNSNALSTCSSVTSLGSSKSGLTSSTSISAGVRGMSARNVRGLQNRLDKAVVKSNEALSIRRTYEQVLERMRKERPLLDAQLRVLEGKLAGLSGEMEAAARDAREATHAKESAKAELAALEARLTKDRAQRKQALEQQRSQAEAMQVANQALLVHQYPTTTSSQPSLSSSPHNTSSAANDSSTTEAQCATAEDVMKRLSMVVAAAAAAAGSSSSTARLKHTVDHLLAQQASYDQLQGMLRQGRQQVSELEAKEEALEEKLADLRGGGKLTTQAQLDAAQTLLREASVKADSARESHDMRLRCYVGVKGGLEHLASLVSPLPLSEPALALQDDTVGDVLGQCEARLLAGLRFIETLPKAAALLESLNSHPDYAFTPA